MTTEDKKACCAEKSEGGMCCKTVTIIAVIVAIAAVIWGVSKDGGSSTMASKPNVDVATLIEGDDTVVATLDGEKIMKSDVALAIRDLGANVPPENIDQILPAFIEQYINLKLINKAAEAAGVDKDPEVSIQLANSYNQIVRAAYLNNIFAEQVTEDAMKAAYKARYEDQPMPEEISARHILVDDEEKAKDLIKQLNAGAKFEKLAEEHSKDPSATRGGDLGYFVTTEMVPEFGAAAAALDKGTMSQTPVKTQFGWHVIKVEDKRQRVKPSFEEAKSAMEQEARQAILDGRLNELRSAAKIEIEGSAQQASAAEGDTPPVAPEGDAPDAGAPVPAPEMAE